MEAWGNFSDRSKFRRVPCRGQARTGEAGRLCEVWGSAPRQLNKGVVAKTNHKLWSAGSAAQHNPVVDSPTIKFCAFTGWIDWFLFTGQIDRRKGLKEHVSMVKFTYATENVADWVIVCLVADQRWGIVVLHKFPPGYGKRNSTPTPRRRLSLLPNTSSKRVCPFRKTSYRVTGFCLSALISVSPRNVSRFPPTNLTLT